MGAKDKISPGLDVDILARTIWGEARGEGLAGMQAVACVVMNRVRIGGWWGNTISEVCQKPFQFSAWNKNDPNYKKILNIDTGDAHFAAAMRIAKRAIEGSLEDITEEATHYHVAGITPYWVKGEKPTSVIGNHIFYKIT